MCYSSASQHFGLRRRQEHYPGLTEDLQLGTDKEGLEYLTLSEKRTKTRQGAFQNENTSYNYNNSSNLTHEINLSRLKNHCFLRQEKV